jgi:hypothetical protein
LSALTRSRALSWNRKINREAHFQFVLDIILYFAKLRTMNQVFKALSDPTRRQILHLLRTKPMTAGELAEHFLSPNPPVRAISQSCAKQT